MTAECSASVNPVAESFDEQLDRLRVDGKLTYFSKYFHPDYRKHWTNMFGIGGRVHLVKMKCTYTQADVTDALLTVPRQPGEVVQLGTAEDLAVCAGDKVHDNDWIVAFGSIFEHSNGEPLVPCLRGVGRNRGLSVDWYLDQWSKRYLLLCIRSRFQS